ncbi:MAG: T9SS type A sorting domain-containing protein, partial [Cyclobacteriaceae bacterium]
TISGPTQSCESAVYSVQAQEGHTYTWEVIGGQISDGQGTHQISVDWVDSDELLVKVMVKNKDECFNEISLEIELQETLPEICSITFNDKGDAVIISWENSNSPTTFNLVKSVDGENSITQEIGSEINEVEIEADEFGMYYLSYENQCGAVINSSIVSPIYLEVMEEAGTSVKLVWNSYVGSEVAENSIYRGPSRNNLELYAKVEGDINEFVDNQISVSQKVYQIQAIVNSCLDEVIVISNPFKANDVITSISILESNDYLIYPNPVGSRLHIRLPNNLTPTASNVKYAFIDVSGRAFEKGSIASINEKITVNTEQLDSGIYYFVIYWDKQSFIKKIIKK